MTGKTRLQLHAPAKLNLSLFVGPKRSDGLHEICSLFQPISLADEVSLELGVSERDEVVCPGIEGPNLAALALARFRERFGWDGPPVRITIEKRIPVAAGLGGGSADAGAVLRLAVRASGLPVGVEDLIELAPSIGADVPSQVEPGSYFVRGAGEIVERLPKQWHLAALLLTSQRGLSTADVYAQADRLGTPRKDLEHISQRLRQAATAAGYSPLSLTEEVLHNDLQKAAVELEPTAGEALDLLWHSGAFVALITGSGPTAFGLYRDDAAAEAARAQLAPRWPGQAITVVHARSDYAIVRSD